MATFDDLRKVLQDTIRVDMKERWTPQVVKFINNKNEFYGTFNGKIFATGGSISDVGLSNVSFYDAEGNQIDLNAILDIGSRVNDIEFQLVSLSNVLNNEVPQWIYNSVSSVSVELDEKIDTEISNRKLADSELCSYLINKIESSQENIYNHIESISNLISSRIDGVDERITDLENKVDENFDFLSGVISSQVETINERIDEEIQEVSEYFDNKILHDKHYSIETVSNTDKNYKLKDFTLNVINDTMNDGTVMFNTTDIGKIQNVIKDKQG